MKAVVYALVVLVVMCLVVGAEPESGKIECPVKEVKGPISQEQIQVLVRMPFQDFEIFEFEVPDGFTISVYAEQYKGTRWVRGKSSGYYRGLPGGKTVLTLTSQVIPSVREQKEAFGAFEPKCLMLSMALGNRVNAGFFSFLLTKDYSIGRCDFPVKGETILRPGKKVPLYAWTFKKFRKDKPLPPAPPELRANSLEELLKKNDKTIVFSVSLEQKKEKKK